MGLHPRGVRAIRCPIYVLLTVGLAQSPFSGSNVVWAYLAADTTVRDSVEIQVHVDSLVGFEAGSYWLLTGVPGENSHGLNHLGFEGGN